MPVAGSAPKRSRGSGGVRRGAVCEPRPLRPGWSRVAGAVDEANETPPPGRGTAGGSARAGTASRPRHRHPPPPSRPFHVGAAGMAAGRAAPSRPRRCRGTSHSSFRPAGCRPEKRVPVPRQRGDAGSRRSITSHRDRRNKPRAPIQEGSANLSALGKGARAVPRQLCLLAWAGCASAAGAVRSTKTHPGFLPGWEVSSLGRRCPVARPVQTSWAGRRPGAHPEEELPAHGGAGLTAWAGLLAWEGLVSAAWAILSNNRFTK